MALTFRDMQDQVLDITKSAVYTDRNRVKDIINDVHAQIIAEILTTIKTAGPTTLTNNVPDYVLSAAPFSLTDFVAMRDVIYNQSGVGPNNTLDQLTPHEIYRMRNQTYSGWLSAFAIEGVDKLMLSPSPTTGDTITLVYQYRPTPMSVDTDTSSVLLPEDTDAIIVGAAWKVCRWKNPALAAEFEIEYQRLLGKAQARQNRKAGAGDLKMQLSAKRRRPHDNSTDTGW